MPNHVTQVLTFEGAGAFERLRAYFTDFDVTNPDTGRREQWRGFDFGKAIHRPPIVDQVVENGSDRYIPFLMALDGAYLLWEQLRTDYGGRFAALPRWPGYAAMRDGWMEKHLREVVGDAPIDNAYRMIRCFAETGAKGWYDWGVKNWGTKWNAYSSDTDPGGRPDCARVKFDTAWCSPEPVLRAIAKREPDLELRYVAFCEGWNFYARGNGADGAFDLRTCEALRSDPDAIAAYVECYGKEPGPEEADDDELEPTP